LSASGCDQKPVPVSTIDSPVLELPLHKSDDLCIGSWAARPLFAIPVQRNDLTVLTHSFDSSPATLIRGSPIGGNIVGVGNPEELSQVSIQPPKLFHSSLD
jgi:hypothetical protein